MPFGILEIPISFLVFKKYSFSKNDLTSLKVGIICFSTASFPAFFNESTVCLSKDLGRFKKGEK